MSVGIAKIRLVLGERRSWPEMTVRGRSIDLICVVDSIRVPDASREEASS